MGKMLAERHAEARRVFEEVDEALGQKLSALAWNGPGTELDLTANAQPALMATSLASLRALEVETGFNLARDASFVAGHSLGEYSALAAAGVVSIADAARLLRVRGNAMQKAVPVGEGAMAALLGLDLAGASDVARDAASGDVCDVANDNGPGQVVVSGHKRAVERAVVLAGERGARRAILLPVSAPFHCALMQPAANTMRDALALLNLQAPSLPVVSNVEAAPLSDPGAIRDALVRQVTGTVRWRESVAAMAAAGVDRFVEIGAGKVLAGLVKRIATGARVASFGQPADLEAARAILGR